MKAIDIETTGLNWQRDDIVLVGCADASGAREIAPEALVHEEEPCVWHNGKFDYKFLKRMGINVHLDEDTLIAASLLPVPLDVDLSLEDLAAYYLHYKPWKIDWKKEKAPTRERVVEHCLNDCKATLGLWRVLLQRLESEGQLSYYQKYSMPFNRLLADTEYNGIRVNFEAVGELKASLSLEVARLENEIRSTWAPQLQEASLQYNLMRIKPLIPGLYYVKGNREISEKRYNSLKCKDGWERGRGLMPSAILKDEVAREKIKLCPPPLNLGSPLQLRVFLELLGIVLKDREGKVTTNRHEMEYSSSKHPILGKILAYRDSIKQISFLESWEKYRAGDRLHTNYNMAGRAETGGKWKRGARTGRLTSSEPNLQQIDTRMRNLFIPDEGCVFVGGDFSQIEMRLIAHFTHDSRMMEIFNDGVDFYGQVAVDMFGLSCKASEVKELEPSKRDIAKMISLAIPYGMWADTLAYRARLAGIELSAESARDYLNEWYAIYRGVRPYKSVLGQFASQKGYVRSIYGRKVYIPREEADHKALDYRCQSSGHEMTALPQIKIQPLVQGFASPTFFLHDEIWYNCRNNKDDIDRLSSIMLSYMVDKQIQLLKLSVPLVLDISTRATL